MRRILITKKDRLMSHRRRLRCGILIACIAVGLASNALAQFVVNYTFTPNTNVPDNGQYVDVRTLGGFASYSDINVQLSLTTQNNNDPMWLGDIYSSLTYGTARELSRTAVLLNRVGHDNTDNFGSSLSSLNVTFDDSASDNVWHTTTGTGTYRPDARLNVDPYGPGVAFNDNGTGTLGALNGNALTSNKFAFLVADTQQGGTATFSSWGMTATGVAAGSGTLSGDGGTFSISDTGSGATNNVGAGVVTTQQGGGPLVVDVAGTMNFNGAVSGSSGLTKQGTGTLSLNAAGTYTGATNVNGGTLLVNNTSGSGTGTGTVTVNNSGTILGGTGTISGAVTINQNASMTGGTNGGVGTLTLSNGATFTGASSNLATYINDISGATADKLVISGALNLTNAFDRILFNGTADGTTTYVLATYTSVSGTFDTVTNLPAGYELIYGLTELDLTPVPEPATWIGGALALMVIGYSARKRFVRRAA